METEQDKRHRIYTEQAAQGAPNPLRRASAISELSPQQNPEHLGIILKRAKEDPDGYVREEAASWLDPNDDIQLDAIVKCLANKDGYAYQNNGALDRINKNLKLFLTSGSYEENQHKLSQMIKDNAEELDLQTLARVLTSMLPKGFVETVLINTVAPTPKCSERTRVPQPAHS